jgi:hypothetical protein
MENIIQNKIDSVLDRIKEPQSGLSLSQIGFVEKIRCNSEGKKLIVFTNRLGHSKACCIALNMIVLGHIEKTLVEELKKEFPNHSIEFAG